MGGGGAVGTGGDGSRVGACGAMAIGGGGDLGWMLMLPGPSMWGEEHGEEATGVLP